MNIVIEESGKRFKLKMMARKDNNWVSLKADGSFKWDNELDAWVFTGRENDLTNWLWDWENYNTEADIQAWSAEKRAELRNEYDRYFELTEVKE